MMDRRKFLKTHQAGAIALMVPGILDRVGFQPPMTDGQDDHMTILFQGDSITDARRDRGSYYANQASGMGHGYVMLAAAEILGSHPGVDVKVFNRGISGNKVYQLDDRWDIDCLSLEPDVLSILIGVNDFWHTLGGNYDGTREVYAQDLRRLLDRTRTALPGVKLLIGEPFAVAGGRAIDERWDDFHGYRTSCAEIAADFGAAFIPYHGIFDEALKDAPASFWCPDGVHPSMAGAYLMKEAWMRAFRGL